MRISGCRLKEKTQDRLAEFFVGGVTARSAVDLAGVNRKTAAYFFHRLREIIARQLEDSLPLEGLVEVDESYFGGVRKGKRGRGAAIKVAVFGILKRGGIGCFGEPEASDAEAQVQSRVQDRGVPFGG